MFVLKFLPFYLFLYTFICTYLVEMYAKLHKIGKRKICKNVYVDNYLHCDYHIILLFNTLFFIKL